MCLFQAKENCNGLELDGRRIRVDYSITKRAHTPTPGVYMGRPTRSRDEDRVDRDDRYDDRTYDRGYDRDYGEWGEHGMLYLEYNGGLYLEYNGGIIWSTMVCSIWSELYLEYSGGL